ncbi:TetR/AcrR family transcriptional regulator [Amycolatopsis sp.]|uniref:TetR/AcrR family transcriptional regulator n=1 Tax=Amycolatopsis sp. TaxID=37632 RepID=UPI0026238EBD|nr:TetR/AcrR family transcriptional regulator [Amycolatopsis sp.]
MSPRRSAADARDTRSAILVRGLEIASAEGMEGVTIGRLAADLGLSKSGLLGHFGTKETLQLALVDTAAEAFSREVSDPADGTAFGMDHLVALCAAWVSYLERGVLPGGCFFMAAASEFDDRPGPVRDAVAGLHSLWQNDLRRHIRLAIAAGELPDGTEADQLLFELGGVMLALNHALQLYGDRTAIERTRRAMGRLLGRPLPAPTATRRRVAV